jgi:transketolase
MWGMKYKNEQIKKLTKYKNIISVENHLQDGGFGSWLNESLAIAKINNQNTKIISKFIDSRVVGKVGEAGYLNQKFGPR